MSGSRRSRASTRWGGLWHRSGGGREGYLLPRVIYALVAIDAWRGLLRRGLVHGAGGFDVAHFRLLDGLPLPSPELYQGALFVTAFVSTAMVVGGSSRLGAWTVAAAYTYGWAMSRLDSFQHHYFLSLVLLCLALVPHARLAARDPAAPAWPLRLLAATAAIMYVFAVVAKAEPKWLGGATVAFIFSRSPWLSGLATPTFGRVFGVGAMVVELVIAAGYVAYVSRPEARRLRLGAWGASIGLHGGIELLELHIGMFSFYMLAIATVLLGPSEALARLEQVARKLGVAADRAAPRDAGLGVVLACVLGGLAIVTGKLVSLELPGVVGASVLTSLGMVAAAVALLLRKREGVASLTLGHVGALLTWWGIIAVSSLEANLFTLGAWLAP